MIPAETLETVDAIPRNRASPAWSLGLFQRKHHGDVDLWPRGKNKHFFIKLTLNVDLIKLNFCFQIKDSVFEGWSVALFFLFFLVFLYRISILNYRLACVLHFNWPQSQKFTSVVSPSCRVFISQHLLGGGATNSAWQRWDNRTGWCTHIEA